MYYSIFNNHLRYLIDCHKTGDFGEIAEGGDIFCDECRGKIHTGDNYYLVRDNVYCLGCEYEAGEQILGLMRNEFLYQL